MDTSETYQRMADCPEIQEGHKWEYGDWLIAEHGVFQIGTATFDYDVSDKSRPPIRSELPIATIQAEDVDGSIFTGRLIWLPRQDQLQAMVWGKLGDYCTNKISSLTWGVWDFYLKAGDNNYPDSMEQLWLAFLMKVLHGKVWNNERWVSQ